MKKGLLVFALRFVTTSFSLPSASSPVSTFSTFSPSPISSPTPSSSFSSPSSSPLSSQSLTSSSSTSPYPPTPTPSSTHPTPSPSLSNSSHTLVQTFSSRYGLVVGGYGPGYSELREVDVVSHSGVCSDAVSRLPGQISRYLGDVSGLAEYVDNGVLFCRHTECWRLDLHKNLWNRTASLKYERSSGVSVEVGGRMVVLGGNPGEDALEIYHPTTREWTLRTDLKLPEPRYSFCAAPINSSSLLVAGGWNGDKPLASVELLDLETGAWTSAPPLPHPSYGHACLHTEIRGRDGIMVTGGALTGRKVLFYDLVDKVWSELPDLIYRTDGHKLISIEGVPTVFGWENIQQFDGTRWRMSELGLHHSRSAFAVASVPGHLLPVCS